MKQTEFTQNVKMAMAIFLLFAGIIFSSALVYTVLTENTFAEIILLSAGTLITGVIIYLNKKIKD